MIDRMHSPAMTSTQDTASPGTDELTNEQYWSSIWEKTAPGSIALWEQDPAVWHQMRMIADVIGELRRSRQRVRILEVGCANSFWLPYIASRFDVDVYGVDFSPLGCAQAYQQAARRNVSANLWCQDFFSFAEARQSCFDLVISFGFIEHFADPSVALRAMHEILSPGGYMYATVPNIVGVYGTLQRLINEEVYDAHVPMVPHDIQKYAHEARFTNVTAGYTGGLFKFGVLNFQTGKSGYEYAVLNYVRRGLRAVDLVAGWLLEAFDLNKNHRFASPYVYALGQKPASGA